MADVGNLNPVKGLGTDLVIYAGSFQCNGTSNPASTTFRSETGLLFSVVYSATGVFTVTLTDPSLNLPDLPVFIGAEPQGAVLATDWFDTFILGEFNRTTRSFAIQAHRSGTGQAPANTAGNRINFWILFKNTTAR
jgi:hypothetical protein